MSRLVKQKIKVAGQGQSKRSNRQGQHHALKAQRITSDTDGVCGYETTEYLSFLCRHFHLTTMKPFPGQNMT